MAATIMRGAIERQQNLVVEAAGMDTSIGGRYAPQEDRGRRLRQGRVAAGETSAAGFATAKPKKMQGPLVVSGSMSTQAQDEARAQALRGKWRKPRACKDLFKGKSSLFSPASPWMKNWDLLMAILLLFTASVTPFEVAFLETEVNFLFFLNRLVDMLFFLDMLVNFMAPYQGKGKEEGQWIYDAKKIASNYLRGWFTIDILSLLPFDLIGLVATNPEVRKLKAVRVVRLFRLLKLFRVFRAKRIMARWETLIDFNYKLVSLLKFACIMCAVAHWMSCVWMLAANINSACVNICHDQDDDLLPEMTWVDAVDLTGKPPLDLYAAALYWSVMTLSTIGYGDITPQNTTETLIGVFCMLCGASLWAYVVGNVCGVVASLDVRTLAFRQTMDDLNFFMSEKALDHDLRGRLREYFHQARHMHQTGNYEGLLRKLSPKLRGEVALATNRDWISKVSYFRHIRDECLSAIAVSLQASVYAPQEIVTGFKLHIVMRGVAGQQGRIITRGNVWGEDMILEARHLARVRPVRALTYLDVYALSREDLFDILEDYPATKKRIQRAALLMALVRTASLIRKMEAKNNGPLDPLTVLESKQDSHAAEEKQSLVHMEEADNVKNMMGSTLDASRIEARIALKTETLVKDRVSRLEQKFATLTAQLEERVIALLNVPSARSTGGQSRPA